jgi:hypothetical protein
MWLLQTRAMRDTICHQRFYLRSYESNCTDKSFVPYIICIWLLTWTISVGLSLQYSSFDSRLGLSALSLHSILCIWLLNMTVRVGFMILIRYIWLLTWLLSFDFIGFISNTRLMNRILSVVALCWSYGLDTQQLHPCLTSHRLSFDLDTLHSASDMAFLFSTVCTTTYLRIRTHKTRNSYMCLELLNI